MQKVTGIVERGAGRGRELGYPTANLGDIIGTLPPVGIYAGWTELPNGRRVASAISCSDNPMFPGDDITFESHLLDFDEDLYDQCLTVELVAFIRPPAKFESIDALIDQMAKDCDNARELLGT